MKEVIIDDKRSVDDAVSEALALLGAKKEDVIIEVLEESGLFTKAKVRVCLKESALDKARAFANGLLPYLNAQATISAEEAEGEIKLNFEGEDVGGLIGYRGEVLDAIQYLCSIIVNLGSGKDNYTRVQVNAEGYRERRSEALEALADRMADKAVASGRRISLDPMNPYERRIIHMHLQENPEVTAHSEGEEPNRRLIIVPKGEKPSKHGNSRKGFNGRTNNNNNRADANNSGGNRRRQQADSYRSSAYSENNYSTRGSGFSDGGFSDGYRYGSSGFSESDLSNSGKNYTSSKKYNK